MLCLGVVTHVRIWKTLTIWHLNFCENKSFHVVFNRCFIYCATSCRWLHGNSLLQKFRMESKIRFQNGIKYRKWKFAVFKQTRTKVFKLCTSAKIKMVVFEQWETLKLIERAIARNTYYFRLFSKTWAFIVALLSALNSLKLF